MTITQASDPTSWDDFLRAQPYSPFLQSWTMGEVYRATNQEPIRLVAEDNGNVVGICQVVLVPARRGRHLSVPYGPVVSTNHQSPITNMLIEELRKVALEKGCSFIRLSPFWNKEDAIAVQHARPAPLHLLAEQIWYIDLQDKTEEDLLKGMRKNTRNLVRRAEREGVEVIASQDPERDIETFLTLHEETRKRHQFTPYTDQFFREQVSQFSKDNACTLYLARHKGDVLATSIHMHFGGETSYHHGASKVTKIPASYLLQWTAIKDALARGDHLYNFWGIAPEGVRNHPFAGVTTFKRGFGGELMELVHCMDVPLKPHYTLTRGFEMLRKWRRGF